MYMYLYENLEKKIFAFVHSMFAMDLGRSFNLMAEP